MIHTPLGQFATIQAAARAHSCDRHTITRRLKDDPKNYRRTQVTVTTVSTWAEYRWLPEDVKQAQYDSWCAAQGLDPDQESTATAFFDAMDSVAADGADAQEETEDIAE